MNDHDKVRAIERAAELRLLEQLLIERTRPVPAPPVDRSHVVDKEPTAKSSKKICRSTRSPQAHRGSLNS
jgi:hypothetical protein